ncbi:uncharacterized protein LOC128670552 [Plodia interpunctella]|uniref:uncharacterized protein LOC128670552 n=1 Tax=Plodia interpunctella TaxID=58824 RepID=UPI0023681A7A|nr:uncharacterized protein LOC128670552 [Plodia interpunctella]
MFMTNFIKIFLLFINVVRSSDIPNDAYKQTLDRVVREVYKYNIPPEEAIPVAIVYDKDGDREGKSIDHKVNNTNINIEANKKISDDKSPTVIRVTSDFSVKSGDTDKVTDTPRISVTTEDNLQIPVAVIYDDKPTNVKKHRKALRRSKIRNQNQLNRRPDNVEQTMLSNNDTPIVDIQNTSQQQKTSTEKINETGKSKKEVVLDKTKVRQGSRERDPVIPILQSENKVFGNSGDFRYSYEGGDGTQVFSTGELKSYDDNSKGEAVVGGFSYTDKNGQDFSLSYTADENGYRPVGAHLPTPPPIPPAIERALRYLATKPTPESETVTDSNEPSN